MNIFKSIDLMAHLAHDMCVLMQDGVEKIADEMQPRSRAFSLSAQPTITFGVRRLADWPVAARAPQADRFGTPPRY